MGVYGCKGIKQRHVQDAAGRMNLAVFSKSSWDLCEICGRCEGDEFVPETRNCELSFIF